MIEWGQTPHLDPWVRLNGKTLCSTRDPWKEAQEWLVEVDSFGFSEIHIVGIGLGYHLLKVCEKWGSVQVHAYDTKEELNFETWPQTHQRQFHNFQNRLQLYFGGKARLKSDRLPLGPVFQFRGACAEEDLQLFEKLRGQESNQFQGWCERLAWTDLSNARENLSAEWGVNIKSFSDEKMTSQSEVARLHRVLKELVK